MRPIIGLSTALISAADNMPVERYGVAVHYCQAIWAAGGTPLMIPGLGDPEAVADIFPLLDGLLLTGGLDVHPRRYGQEIHPGCDRIDESRDATELALLSHLQRSDLPLLGICRGIQMINVGFGGTLIQDIPMQRPGSFDHQASIPVASLTSHEIQIAPGSQLATILDTDSIPVNSLHHQAVDTVAPGFVATAWSEDATIEAIEARGHRFAIGVQCHPEHLYRNDQRWLRLFSAFVEAAARIRVERQVRSA